MPQLNWVGKDKIVRHAAEVPFRVLDESYSYGADPQGNMIIHGDNLAALKSLLPRYEGRVRCIYIDPPYNTGNEKWVYNDNVNDPRIKKWLGEVVGKEGEDLSRHDKWLCMMYPRLVLLQRLLSDDGAIFISIDDNEQANLKLICDEIFGARNFITNFIWRKVDSPNDNKVPLTPDHEFIIAYAKDKGKIKLHQMEAPDIVKAYGSIDENGRRYRDRLLKKNGRNSMREDRPTMFFPLTAPNGESVYPIHDDGKEARWSMGKTGIEKHIEANTLIWKKKSKLGKEIYEPYTREFAPDNPTRPYPSIWSDLHTMRQAKALLRSIYGEVNFETPKPPNLIERILQIATDKDSLVLDSFAGSGTTAHAVLNLNKADGGHRRFILIEMMDYAESITAERVRRVIDGYGAGKQKTEGTGGGFTFYEIGEPLLIDGMLNEHIDEKIIREYIWYTETRSAAKSTDAAEDRGAARRAYLGTANDTAVYFHYVRDSETWLDASFWRGVHETAQSYVIYADACALSDDFLKSHHIKFKKIPRDIRRI
ncbi:MAG: site-specific DNA-methyltransferase [Selenomonadaceae bacterium]